MLNRILEEDCQDRDPFKSKYIGKTIGAQNAFKKSLGCIPLKFYYIALNPLQIHLKLVQNLRKPAPNLPKSARKPGEAGREL